MEKVERGALPSPSVLSVPDFSSTGRLIFDISTEQFKAIDDPCLRDANCVYNKGGWLLMRPQHHITKRLTGSLFLFNPATGVKIELPVTKELYAPGFFNFSIVDGTPDRVVHVNNVGMGDPRGCYGFSIQVIRPGDKEWEVHAFDRCSNCYKSMIDVSVVGTQVLCIDFAGEVKSFDLLEGSWATFARPANPCPHGRVYRVESEPEPEARVLRVLCPYPSFSSFSFQRLDLRRMEWALLNDTELENTSWFLGDPCSFYRREEGKKVYTLFNEYEGPRPPLFEPGTQRMRKCRGRPVGSDVERNVYVHDLVTNVTETLLPDSFRTKSAHWIDADFRG